MRKTLDSIPSTDFLNHRFFLSTAANVEITQGEAI
jgi:hypothetical protein